MKQIAVTTVTDGDRTQPFLGEILQQAGLLNQVQVDFVLRDQATYGYGLTFDEILALRGWVKQETSNFFLYRWSEIQQAIQTGGDRRRIGEYLLEAHLLDRSQIQEILQVQRRTKLPFGKIAVAKGYLRQETLNFFVQHLLINPRKNQRINYYIKRAQKDLQNQDLQGAMIELRAALKINPNHAKCHALLAKTYAFQNQISFAKAHWKLARIHLKQALRINPKDTVINEFYFQEELQGYFSTLGTATTRHTASHSPLSLAAFSPLYRWGWQP